MSRRFVRVALALVVLLSAIAGPGAGTAVAAEAGDCSNLDTFIMFLSLGAVNGDSCSRTAYVDAAVDEMQQVDADQTEVDIYNYAEIQKAHSETYLAQEMNYIQDSESVAWMKVQTAVANAYENGSSQAGAKAAARDAIDDYYSVKQMQLLDSWNASATATHAFVAQASQETGITQSPIGSQDGSTGYDNTDYWVDENDYVHFNYVAGSSEYSDPYTYHGAHARNITLLNGTQTQTTSLLLRCGPCASGGPNYINPKNGIAQTSYGTADKTIISTPSTHDYPPIELVDWNVYDEKWSKIQTVRDGLVAESDQFVEATYGDFESGKINASDVISANTAMFEFGVRSGNESEGLWRSAAWLSAMGYDTPNLNNSGTMNVTYGGETFNGLVMAESAPNGSWQAGMTYNTSNIDGTVFFLTTDGRKVDTDEGDMFTLNEMRAKDGSEVQTVETTKYVYKTANTSELLQMQMELTELRQEIEDRESQVGGGGGSGDGDSTGGFGDTEIVGIAVIGTLFAVIVLTRS
ncbi:hypothetical protein [Haloprofundus salinisoli]|uniref:hypothetical protein n=1 Tax=Haloprofundus salinisoli TaxID=2876193 RepID=UPI001CCFA60E|nr:hypothetical protein [Haloprofundus salinisoli]